MWSIDREQAQPWHVSPRAFAFEIREVESKGQSCDLRQRTANNHTCVHVYINGRRGT